MPLSQAQWLSPYYIDHPLAGKIFSLRESNWVSYEEIEKSVRNVSVLLLGETHTNPDHHQGHASLLEAWSIGPDSHALVLEMLDIESWQEYPQIWFDLEKLYSSLESITRAWDWDLYRPVLEYAIRHKSPIIAGNLSSQQRSYYGEEGNCRLELYGKELEFCDTMSAAQSSELEELIADAHCGYLQPGQVKSLARTQIAKDASFALSVNDAGLRHRVALIAGTVHVRKDIGVPHHLRKLGIDSVSIAFIPVDPEKTKPGEYFNEELGQPFDYIFFTPSDRNVDPCVEFAEQLKRMKKTE